CEGYHPKASSGRRGRRLGRWLACVYACEIPGAASVAFLPARASTGGYFKARADEEIIAESALLDIGHRHKSLSLGNQKGSVSRSLQEYLGASAHEQFNNEKIDAALRDRVQRAIDYSVFGALDVNLHEPEVTNPRVSRKIVKGERLHFDRLFF